MIVTSARDLSVTSFESLVKQEPLVMLILIVVVPLGPADQVTFLEPFPLVIVPLHGAR